MSEPEVTIITATLNRLAMLKEAVESVQRQASSIAVEHIIVDGGSTDGTIEWVAAQAYLRLLRGPDCGVYDALNKGLATARGKLVAFLNSDDLLLPGALEASLDRLADNRFAAAAGIGVVMDSQLKQKLRIFDRPGEIIQDLRTLFLGHCALNSHIFRREVFNALGGFSRTHKLVSDKDIMIRFALAGRATAALNRETYCYRRHSGSLTFDPDRTKQGQLRRELIALALKWQRSDAPPEARMLSRILEGRSRLGLIRLAVVGTPSRSSHLSAAFDPCAWRAANAMAYACLEPLHLNRPGFS